MSSENTPYEPEYITLPTAPFTGGMGEMVIPSPAYSFQPVDNLVATRLTSQTIFTPVSNTGVTLPPVADFPSYLSCNFGPPALVRHRTIWVGCKCICDRIIEYDIVVDNVLAGVKRPCGHRGFFTSSISPLIGQSMHELNVPVLYQDYAFLKRDSSEDEAVEPLYKRAKRFHITEAPCFANPTGPVDFTMSSHGSIPETDDVTINHEALRDARKRYKRDHEVGHSKTPSKKSATTSTTSNLNVSQVPPKSVKPVVSVAPLKNVQPCENPKPTVVAVTPVVTDPKTKNVKKFEPVIDNYRLFYKDLQVNSSDRIFPWLFNCYTLLVFLLIISDYATYACTIGHGDRYAKFLNCLIACTDCLNGSACNCVFDYASAIVAWSITLTYFVVYWIILDYPMEDLKYQGGIEVVNARVDKQIDYLPLTNGKEFKSYRWVKYSKSGLLELRQKHSQLNYTTSSYKVCLSELNNLDLYFSEEPEIAENTVAVHLQERLACDRRFKLLGVTNNLPSV